jgi:hypothetical protein
MSANQAQRVHGQLLQGGKQPDTAPPRPEHGGKEGMCSTLADEPLNHVREREFCWLEPSLGRAQLAPEHRNLLSCDANRAREADMEV